MQRKKSEFIQLITALKIKNFSVQTKMKVESCFSVEKWFQSLGILKIFAFSGILPRWGTQSDMFQRKNNRRNFFLTPAKLGKQKVHN